MKIAITGTIGSGKSYVSNIIRNAGYEVFDCDGYNAILLTDQKVIDFIDKQFSCVENNKVNKRKLAEIIFNDQKKKKVLEDYLHPLILDEMLKEASNKDIFFAEVPLLFETDMDKYFDEKILVVSKNEDIIERLSKDRGLEMSDIKQRLKNQMPQIEKEKRASKIIYNVSDLETLESKVLECLKELNVR